MTYREKITEIGPYEIDYNAWGGVKGCPGTHFKNAPFNSMTGCIGASDANCTKCWNREIPEATTKETTSFQEDMMVVLGDMTEAQAKFAIEYLWNKYFKEEK